MNTMDGPQLPLEPPTVQPIADIVPKRPEHEPIALAASSKTNGLCCSIEYGMISALVAVVIVAAVSLIGTNLSTTFNTIAGAI